MLRLPLRTAAGSGSDECRRFSCMPIGTRGVVEKFKAVPGWRLFVARCTNTRCNAWILGNATRACTLSDDNYGGDQHALAYPHSVGWRRRASVGRRLLYPPCNPCVSLNDGSSSIEH